MLELDFFDRSFQGPILRVLSLPEKRRARGVNSFDEVPDSTWFTNRIGVRDLTPEEVGKGPGGEDDGPEAHKPWTIHSTKPGGTEIGFIMTDARGVKYGLGFDGTDYPEVETGAAVVVNRLLWAFGYNVPDDRVAFVRPDELVVAPDAVVKDTQGRKLFHLDRKEVDRQLAKVWHTPDGQIRVVASRWLSGESLGGTPPSGTRRGDPNDRIAHEDRRDLRGQYPVFSWVEHLDLVRGNFLDMLVGSPDDPSRRYVIHYMIDFGRSMGTLPAIEKNLRSNHRYLFDWSEPIWSLGLAPRPWGHHWAPPLLGVSPTFVSTGFDPGEWRPDIPYPPFVASDRFDMFWGAKILAHFTPAQIRAAVEAGRYSDPRTVDYLTQTLIERQRAIIEYWYTRVNPLDKFTTDPAGLCFQDLAIKQELAPAAQTRYLLKSYDRNNQRLSYVSVPAMPSGTTCTSSATLATDGDGYTIIKVTTERPGYVHSTVVHLAKDPATGSWRVIGVLRM
ncbi:MAG: hypothetical protein HOV81_20270 [Kofleriaceae bacterium]|nr:hypothetical protein [Kofleriaceae bacterium]